MISAAERELAFREDGTFHILMMSDFHGHDRSGPQLKEGIDALVEAAGPDLVLLGGDQLGAESPERLHNYLRHTLSILEERGIPWAHVFGNHDREQPMSLEEQEKVYEEFPLCLTKAGPEDVNGVGNYVLPVLSSDRRKIAWCVWGMDSFREYPDYQKAFGRPEYRYILPNTFGSGSVQASALFDQVAWYYETSKAMEKAAGYRIPSVMFMHVPLLELHLIAKNPEACRMTGEMREPICCSELSNGLFMACQQRGDVRGIFFGHEHLNDFCGDLFGITMGYDSAVGYDMSGADDMRGGREIILHESDGTLSTRHIKLLELLGDRAKRRFPKRLPGLLN